MKRAHPPESSLESQVAELSAAVEARKAAVAKARRRLDESKAALVEAEAKLEKEEGQQESLQAKAELLESHVERLAGLQSSASDDLERVTAAAAAEAAERWQRLQDTVAEVTEATEELRRLWLGHSVAESRRVLPLKLAETAEAQKRLDEVKAAAAEERARMTAERAALREIQASRLLSPREKSDALRVTARSTHLAKKAILDLRVRRLNLGLAEGRSGFLDDSSEDLRELQSLKAAP